MKKFFYRVQQNDQIFELAKRFGVPVTLLVAENNLNAPIYAGQILVVNIQDCALYTVKPTDTLQGLAKRLNQSVEEIKRRNRLDYVYYGINIWV